MDWEGFSLRLRVEAAPRVPRARRLRVEVGSGTEVTAVTSEIAMALKTARPTAPGNTICWKDASAVKVPTTLSAGRVKCVMGDNKNSLDSKDIFLPQLQFESMVGCDYNL